MNLSILDPLPTEIHSLILDQFKLLFPLKSFYLSKSICDEVIPSIYSDITITKLNATSIFSGLKDITSPHFKAIRPRYHARKGQALRHTENIRFEDIDGLLGFLKASTDSKSPYIGAYSWYDPLDDTFILENHDNANENDGVAEDGTGEDHSTGLNDSNNNVPVIFPNVKSVSFAACVVPALANMQDLRRGNLGFQNLQLFHTMSLDMGYHLSPRKVTIDIRGFETKTNVVPTIQVIMNSWKDSLTDLIIHSDMMDRYDLYCDILTLQYSLEHFPPNHTVVLHPTSDDDNLDEVEMARRIVRHMQCMEGNGNRETKVEKVKYVMPRNAERVEVEIRRRAVDQVSGDVIQKITVVNFEGQELE
ncbi:hypothetical protein CI109_106241 [Kwoniella shandongensis]|uniref:Uncharacterized protein n=1 Tax=Kwoniella shandongensis TaxID=1734106 RepID=A0A5M6C1P3_9TREE|nr:uncharacterized protein CI109_003844 [Kwoniella shandongensis]KAA5527872.1 hypothetical protein CI109_003844 [Kwoniella shandongensis]